MHKVTVLRTFHNRHVANRYFRRFYPNAHWADHRHTAGRKPNPLRRIKLDRTPGALVVYPLTLNNGEIQISRVD